MPELVPVDQQPEFDHTLVPVDHNPFAGPTGMIAPANAMLASQNLRDPAVFDPATYAPTDPIISADQMASRQRGLGRGMFDMVRGAAETIPRAMQAAANYQPGMPETYDPAPILQAGLATMGAGPAVGAEARAGEQVLGAGPVRAYHGSPHDFDKFDLSKINTGEGAQAYGHGLYFADKEGVAKSYLPVLDNPVAEQFLKGNKGDWQKASEELSADMDRYRAAYEKMGKVAPVDQAAIDALAILKRGHAGHMYEVNINADPEHFLDWDKPLSEQSPQVRTLEDAYWNQHAKRQPDIRNFLQSPQGAEEARKAGIPGIKYLDQGSRAAGEGSRNYVVFDDKLIDIIKKYGIAGLPAGLAAAAARQFVPVDNDPFADGS